MLNRSVLDRGFQIVAHRGYKALFCENTMPAFEKALEAGATMLELDVRLTADQEAVLLHDATLQRLAGDRRHVASLPWNLLEEMPLLDKRARKQPEGRIARLEELFDRVGTDANYCVEIKHAPGQNSAYHQNLCETVCSLIKKYGLISRCMFVCTEVALLQMLHQTLPQIPVGWVFELKEHLTSVPKPLKQMGAVLCPKMELLEDECVARFKRAGYALMPWTVNQETQMRRLLDWGVIGITTDEVERLVEVCHGNL